jgi:CrcB protein
MADTDPIADPGPMDSDVDLAIPGQRVEMVKAPWLVLAVIAGGGALGALARYGLGVAFRPDATGFPWTTFTINVSGCFLIGVLMVLVTNLWTDQRLIRPFFGVGILGGFTTFTTYVVDFQRLVKSGAPDTALLYLFGTVAAALIAVFIGASITEFFVRNGSAA